MSIKNRRSLAWPVVAKRRSSSRGLSGIGRDWGAARDGGQVAGVLNHVVIRGIERREISLDDKDRGSFLDRPGDILLESAIS